MTGPEAIEGRVWRAVALLHGAADVWDSEKGFQTAAHPLYFSIYQIVLALLATTGVAPETHRGAQQMFSLHFVKSGVFPADFGWRLSQLMTLRGLLDYGVADDVTRGALTEARSHVLAMLPPMLALLREGAPAAGAGIDAAEAALAALRDAG